MTEPILLTLPKAAERMGVSVGVVRHLVKTRQIPVVRVPSGREKPGSKPRAYIHTGDLESWVEANKTTARVG